MPRRILQFDFAGAGRIVWRQKPASMPTPPPAPSRQPSRWLPWWGAAIIAAAGLASYWPTLGAPFLFDDIQGVTLNQSIRDLRHLDRVLLAPPPGTGVDSRPIVNLSLAVNYAISGQEVRGYRLTNVIIHVLGALALFGLVRR